jgi:hypothetical protein
MFIQDSGSRILICTHPGSRISDLGSRIPDPKTATKERGEKKLYVKPFYVATKFNKIVNYFSFEVLKKKIWGNFQRIIVLFTKKIVKKLFEIWSWDPGSEIRDLGSGKNPFRIPDPGSRGQKGPGSGSATLRTSMSYLHKKPPDARPYVQWYTVLYCTV